MPTPTPVRGSTACPILAAVTAMNRPAGKRPFSHSSAYAAAYGDAYIVDALGFQPSRVILRDTSLIPPG